MSEHQIRQIGENSSATLSFLKTTLTTIQNSLKNLDGLPRFFENVMARISESANRQIQAAGEMEIVKKMANLESKKFLVISEKEAITDFKKQLENDIKYIKDQYTKIDHELNEEAVKRVQALDEHLLNLPNIFPRAFIKSYSEKVTPFMIKIKSDNNLSFLERSSLLHNTIDETLESFNNFIKSRHDFFSKIDTYQQDGIKLDKSQTYRLPLTVAEKDGEKHIFLPGSIHISKEIGHSSTYNPEDILSLYYSNINRDEKLSRLDNLDWKFDKKEMDMLEKRLLTFTDKHFSVKNSEIKKAIGEIFKNSQVTTLN